MEVAELVARDAITNILAQHSRGVDRADPELLSGAYHADATVDYGFFFGAASELVSLLTTAQATAAPTLHRTSNIWIKVDGERAVSESYVIAYVEDAGIQRMVMGRYLDRHAMKDGHWALSHRTYLMDANSNRPSTVARPAPSADPASFAAQGAKGAQDPGRALLNHHLLAPQPIPPRSGSHAMTDASIDAVLSRAVIMDLVSAYARAADRGDVELMRSLFHDDATVMCGIANGRGPAFAEAIVAFVTTNLDRCFHSISNSWIEVNGDTAAGEHYVIAHVTAGGNDFLSGGRYVDRYERRDGAWKFASRSFVMDWNSTQPTSHESEGFYAALTMRGCFGKADPVYALWQGS